MAVPPDVVNVADDALERSPLRLTVTVNQVFRPSSSCQTELIVSTGVLGGAASSSVMVTTPMPSAIVAPTGEVRRIWKVSVDSAIESPRIVTVTVLMVSPAAKETVPEADT